MRVFSDYPQLFLPLLKLSSVLPQLSEQPHLNSKLVERSLKTDFVVLHKLGSGLVGAVSCGDEVTRLCPVSSPAQPSPAQPSPAQPSQHTSVFITISLYLAPFPQTAAAAVSRRYLRKCKCNYSNVISS